MVSSSGRFNEGLVVNRLHRTRWGISEIRKSTNRKKITFAIPAEADVIPVNPNNPSIMATLRKMNAQIDMANPSVEF